MTGANTSLDTANVAGTPAATLVTTANTAQSLATHAEADAAAAISGLTAISNDGVLAPSEKPRLIQDVNTILAEQAGIDTQATAYLLTTEQATYDNAITALTNYLATLTSPVKWDNVSGNTNLI